MKTCISSLTKELSTKLGKKKLRLRVGDEVIHLSQKRTGFVEKIFPKLNKVYVSEWELVKGKKRIVLKVDASNLRIISLSKKIKNRKI